MVVRLAAMVLALLSVAACAATGVQGPARVVDSGPPRVLEDGLYVRLFPDGSGSVALGEDVLDASWSVDCGIDKMTDKRKCQFYGPSKSEGQYGSYEGGLFVSYGYSARPEFVCIREHDFPGRTGAIRVDGNAPIETDREGCIPAGKVWAQLQAGSTFVTRRVSWPYDYPIDATFSLVGFNKSAEVVARARGD